jgi:hypothetical protein
VSTLFVVGRRRQVRAFPISAEQRRARKQIVLDETDDQAVRENAEQVVLNRPHTLLIDIKPKVV